MTDVRTRLFIDNNDTLYVNRVQDVEPSLEWSRERAKMANPKGEKFWEKWTLTPVQVEQLFNKYSEGDITKSMNAEFWEWVDKKVMTDPDFEYCRLINKSNPFFMGYKK